MGSITEELVQTELENRIRNDLSKNNTRWDDATDLWVIDVIKKAKASDSKALDEKEAQVKTDYEQAVKERNDKLCATKEQRQSDRMAQKAALERYSCDRTPSARQTTRVEAMRGYAGGQSASSDEYDE
tara:strand:+ start:242 stop:625 length:384 start_codon:yes stop_codon:yes gene_type:complete